MSNIEDLQFLIELVRCPNCYGTTLIINDDFSELCCDECGRNYPLIGLRPVLLRADNKIFKLDDYICNENSSHASTEGEKQNLVPSPSVNLARGKMISRLGECLDEMPAANILVVGGGQQKRWLDKKFGVNGSVRIVYSDIDVSADVDLFCDGHELPFTDASFDAVVTTAVLEHVLYPERVAVEIRRVLKNGGLLYSELPFMQQVHEGAYDFTRYTLSGHRRLFNGFEEIESGMVAGPGTALVWAIENYFLAFSNKKIYRNIVKVAIRFIFVWLKYTDKLLVNNPEAMDGASCTYFFGRKINGSVGDAEIIANYVGAKHMKHV